VVTGVLDKGVRGGGLALVHGYPRHFCYALMKPLWQTLSMVYCRSSVIKGSAIE
jgi:hypothetical protein